MLSYLPFMSLETPLELMRSHHTVATDYRTRIIVVKARGIGKTHGGVFHASTRL